MGKTNERYMLSITGTCNARLASLRCCVKYWEGVGRSIDTQEDKIVDRISLY